MNTINACRKEYNIEKYHDDTLRLLAMHQIKKPASEP
jgi:hypothetical protein